MEYAFYLLAGFLIIYWLTRGVVRRIRRRRAVKTPLPQTTIDLIAKNLPPYARMQREQRRQLHQQMQIFLAEKTFEGCNGLEITEEIRVTIAAQACLLLLGRKIDCYPHLETILVYPSAYVDRQPRLLSTHEHDRGVMLGESWQAGSVVLAWDHVLAGITDYQDGHNVTFHEFAHQLDQADGNADGAPPLASWSAAATWTGVFTQEYQALIEKARKGKRTVLDAYGATHPAEFFAVATEAFFEKPRQLKAKHPAMFDELRSYFCVDPTEWL